MQTINWSQMRFCEASAHTVRALCSVVHLMLAHPADGRLQQAAKQEFLANAKTQRQQAATLEAHTDCCHPQRTVTG